MKEKLIKSIVIIIVITIVTILAVLTYFMLKDTKTTKVPNETKYSCNVDKKMFMNRSVFYITPKNNVNNIENETNKTEKTILYFHGGSYMAEATDEHWNFLEKVVNDTGATVIMPDYPLAPKHNYKDVFEMVEPLYKEIVNSVGADNLIVMGDSAGGGLALALEEKLSQDNIEMPSKTILISPWLDVRLGNPKIDDVKKDDKQLNKEALKLAGIAYAKPDGTNSYLVNPLDGDLSKLKNITIFTGTYDILNPDVKVLKERAQKQNINIEVKEYEKASHIWILKDELSNKNESELIRKGYNDLIETLKN